MNLGIFGSTPPPPAPRVVTPPSIEDIYGGASASTAYAKSLFTDVIEELEGANGDFDNVIARATSEIDRLTALRNAATSQQAANVKTINNLTAFIDA